MDQRIPRGLRTTFLLNAVIAGVFGAQHLLAPRLWTDLAGIVVAETATWRLIGAALLGLAAGSWLAWRERSWQRVRIVVVMHVVWSALGAGVILWALLVEGLPPLEWLNFALLAAFALAFGVFWVRMARRDRRGSPVDGTASP